MKLYYYNSMSFLRTLLMFVFVFSLVGVTESIPTRWSERTKEISTTKLSEIAKKQTVMVVCHRD